MKKGRRKDHKWIFVKYEGDMCIYAKCKCGFIYPCDKETGIGLNREPAIEKLYLYCPLCGSSKKYYDEDIKFMI